MSVIFARSFAEQEEPDGFEVEMDALDQLGVDWTTLPLERVLEDDDKDLDALAPGDCVLRSWILTVDEYESLFERCAERGVHLINDPEAYERAMYLPLWCEALGELTPKSVWSEDPHEAFDLAQTLPRPWMVRDHLKSAKEDWLGACFVDENASREDFLAICAGLKDHRGDDFARGYVVREFVNLSQLPYSMPDRPVFDEHRVMFANGRVSHAPYHDVDAEPLSERELEPIVQTLQARLRLPFFCADLARLPNGGLTVVEINAGEVVRFPAQFDPRPMYRALFG